MLRVLAAVGKADVIGLNISKKYHVEKKISAEKYQKYQVIFSA